MKSKHYFFWSYAILLTILSQGSLAQLLSETEENLVLPDRFYVSARCKEPSQAIELVEKNQELLEKVDIASAKRVAEQIKRVAEQIKRVAEQMNKLCSSFDKKQLAPDVWLTDFERLSESLELLTDAYDPILYMKISIPPAKPIPTNFSAYSLFLFPSAEWSKRDKIDQLSKIRTAFSDFGDAIGNKRAAIWLSTGFNSSDPDIQRSKYFADLFKLNYNEGPFIVTSSRRPDVLLKRDEVIVIKLNQINADRIIKILNILEQDLRNDATIRKRALIYEEIKQRLLSVTDRYPEVAKELAKTAIGMIAK